MAPVTASQLKVIWPLPADPADADKPVGVEGGSTPVGEERANVEKWVVSAVKVTEATL